eukprot:CAMPEP_0180232092 /NCGR_PEP_ID=MMETSP0987-20121128/27259_1 /TAXON_ID=697907 /ORGANISM="non described non described, Strain CCMP2293" /LENGTH=52 /DNA_ID=CAMNT_0022197623 /DNA_START=53 /DNA_END=211 /DNA_ORIENTATION=-
MCLDSLARTRHQAPASRSSGSKLNTPGSQIASQCASCVKPPARIDGARSRSE